MRSDAEHGGATAASRSKAERFHAMLRSPELTFLMEAHNGLSARVVEETGFEGIWASGLSMSAALGVRDSNEASWTQVLEVLEFMADGTTIPILLDGDTGYGNFNNVRRLVRKLAPARASPACASRTSSSRRPTRSSARGSRWPTWTSSAARSRPARSADGELAIVARVEALISGWGLDEALRRAEAYHAAGADAILIHSKRSVADEILAFARGVGPARAAGHRAHHVLRHAHRALPPGRHLGRHLGQPQPARGARAPCAR